MNEDVLVLLMIGAALPLVWVIVLLFLRDWKLLGLQIVGTLLLPFVTLFAIGPHMRFSGAPGQGAGLIVLGLGVCGLAVSGLVSPAVWIARALVRILRSRRMRASAALPHDASDEDAIESAE